MSNPPTPPAAPAPPAGPATAPTPATTTDTSTTPASRRRPRMPAWFTNPQILAAVGLAVALLEVVLLGLVSWVWVVVINVAVLLIVWIGMLAWRRRGRGGLLDRILGGRARRRSPGSGRPGSRTPGGKDSGAGGRKRAGGAGGPGASTGAGAGGLRGLLTRSRSRRRGEGGAAGGGAQGDGSTGGSRRQRRRARRGAEGSGGSGGAAADQAAGGSGSRRSRRRQRREAARAARETAAKTHSTYDGGHGHDRKGKGGADQGGKGKGQKKPGADQGGKGKPGDGQGSSGSSTDTPKPLDTPPAGGGSGPKPAGGGTGPSSAGGGDEPWNDPKFEPQPAGRREPVPEPRPQHRRQEDGGQTVAANDASLQRWAKLVRGTEQTAENVAGHYSRYEAASEDSQTKARIADDARRQAEEAAAAARNCADDDRRAALHAAAEAAWQVSARASERASEAEEVTKQHAAKVTVAKKMWIGDVKALEGYGRDELPAHPQVIAHLESLAAQAEGASTSTEWHGVGSQASAGYPQYLAKHAFEEESLNNPRNGPAAQARADSAYARIDN